MTTTTDLSNVTYISALYNCYSATSVSERLLKDVAILLQQHLDLIIFVDEFYYQALSKLPMSTTVKLVQYQLDQSVIYNMIVANKELLHLPPHRSMEKDTHEYIALMNAKIEFLKLAQEYTTKSYVAWIDAGSSKMISTPDVSYPRLQNLQHKDGLGVFIPGCYQRSVDLPGLMHNVWWNYLGTFLVCERSAINKFYQYSIQSLVKFFTNSTVIWEVNVWIDIHQTHGDVFTWYAADHNDSFTMIPEQHRTMDQWQI